MAVLVPDPGGAFRGEVAEVVGREEQVDARVLVEVEGVGEEKG